MKRNQLFFSKNSAVAFFLMIAFSLSYPIIISAQSGMLDNTFGQNGIVTTSINVSGDAILNCSAVQDDGKIIAAGSSEYDGDKDFTLVRYNSDGSLDNTFGTNGIVVTKIISGDDAIAAVAFQDDNKIIAAGYESENGGSNEKFALARYNPDGSLDNSFGENGIVVTGIGSNPQNAALSVVIQGDGKIIAGGYSGFAGSDIALARYNPNGALDNSFGNNGIVKTKIGSFCGCYSMDLQSDGKIIVGGTAVYSDSIFYMSVLRYNQNGTLDNSFGGGGSVITTINSSEFEIINSVDVQDDGKIAAAGYYYNGSENCIALLRYNTNGALDQSFGTNGIIQNLIISTGKTNKSAIIQSDGKIITIGRGGKGKNDFILLRYNSDGSIDDSFGTNGIVSTTITTISTNYSIDYPVTIALQKNGGILATGYAYDDGKNKFTLVHYNSDGVLDEDFGNYGIVKTPIGKSSCGIWSLSIQSDKKIIAAGYSKNQDNNFDFAVARYNSNGGLDNTFGTNGITTTAIDSGNDNAYSSAIQNLDEQKIIVAGDTYNGSDYDFALVRYKSNGFLDNTFGTSGRVVTPIGSGSNDHARQVLIQNDNKIVVAGYSDNDFALVRYNQDGELDNTFGNNGIVTTTLSSSFTTANSAALQPIDGKIILAGTTDGDITLVRYNIDGSIDDSFGTNGKVITSIGTSNETANSVIVQSDGKIKAAGYYSNGSDNDFALVRYNENGSLDNTFAANGIATTHIGDAADYAYSVAEQSNGKIVAAGYSWNGSDNDFVAVRYNQDGSPDNSFGTDGIITTNVGISSDYAHSIEIEKDGGILVGGYSSNGANYQVFTLGKYTGEAVTGISNNENVLPTQFSLKQNYPNPFNPTTKIKYSIPSTTIEMGHPDESGQVAPSVQLRVYDILGNEVATLVNKRQSAGNYGVTFKPNNLSSGVYFYKLTAGSFTKTKKMILLR